MTALAAREQRRWPTSCPAAEPRLLGRAAILALYDELALAPKPGLVSFVDSGSHDDMDAHTFMRSLFALRQAFPHFSKLGAENASFEVLERAGIEAEIRMLAATRGVNTHRGAIFSLGLLCAAAGRICAESGPLSTDGIRQMLTASWSKALAHRATRPSTSHGARLARQHGLRSANGEAAAGFPVVFEIALPALLDSLQAGLDARAARLNALFAAMTALDDTNVVHRGGMDALRYVKRAASDYLRAGGAGRPDADEHALSLHRSFVRRNLSPGGAADTVAAACWLQRVCALPRGRG